MDRYLIQDRIARGGMGVVFQGSDERLHRPVCVKVFASLDPSRPEYATVLEHFVQEAFTLSRLRHPNTLRIYDFGYLDEQKKSKPFFVTEYADAGTLVELVEDQGGLVPSEVVRILEPVVGALREAHDSGIVHRDIKPSNILFTLAGGGLIPKLADFSIAKATADFPNRAHDTNVRVPLYSLSWAAPEQLTGGYIGPEADVFALGLTTAFMLTSLLVYPGEEIMQLYALRSRGAEYVEETLAGLGLPSAIEEVVQRACRDDPARRFPSVDAFFDALCDAVDADDTKVRRPEIPIVSVDAGPTQSQQPEETQASARVVDPVSGPGLAPHPQMIPPSMDTTERSEASSTAPPPVAEQSGAHPVSPPEGSFAPPAPAPPHLAHPTMTAKPRLELVDLVLPELLVGHRRLRPIEIGDAPLSIPGASTEDAPRVRVTPVEVAGPAAHLKGLNCFLCREGGRPSSGLDLRDSGVVDLLTPSLELAARLLVRLGRRQSDALVFDLAEATLVVPGHLASWALVLEIGAGRDALLLHRR